MGEKPLRDGTTGEFLVNGLKRAKPNVLTEIQSHKQVAGQ